MSDISTAIVKSFLARQNLEAKALSWCLLALSTATSVEATADRIDQILTDLPAASAESLPVNC